MVRELPKTFAFWIWQSARAVVLLLWRIFRPALRFIGAVLMVAAIFALTADVTRWQIGEVVPLFHSLAHHIETIAPATYKKMAEEIIALHPMIWDYGLFTLLSTPAWLIFSSFSIALIFAGRERRNVDIFIN